VLAPALQFILTKAYDVIIAREPWLTLPESFSKLMSTAGLSVMVSRRSLPLCLPLLLDFLLPTTAV
jgi:hypothetical protein